jgi:hypothetical protein
MKKNIFHNSKLINQNTITKFHSQITHENQKLNVDVNKLLNRVRDGAYQEKKSKIIFFSLVTLLISLIGIFLLIIK